MLSKDFRVKYRRTVLGYLWSLGTPLLMTGIFYLVFHRLITNAFSSLDYIAHLLSGVFAWQWFSNSITGSVWSYLHNAALVKKIVFPRWLVPCSLCIIDGLHFLLAVPVIIAVLIWRGHSIDFLLCLYAFPIVFLLQLVFACSLAIICASCNAFFRDIERLVNLGMMLMFYLTPVMYPPELIPPEWQQWLYLNPFALYMQCWRDILLASAFPTLPLAAAGIATGLAVIISICVYRWLSPRFAEVL
ncbi:MAG: ABC transporter permease [Planctomycetota bacterium]|nr:ABC transporter permease [Planctomycetota bacterium]